MEPSQRKESRALAREAPWEQRQGGRRSLSEGHAGPERERREEIGDKPRHELAGLGQV